MYEDQENANVVNCNPNLTVVIQRQRVESSSSHRVIPGMFTTNLPVNMNNSVLAQSGIEDTADMSLNSSGSDIESNVSFTNESVAAPTFNESVTTSINESITVTSTLSSHQDELTATHITETANRKLQCPEFGSALTIFETFDIKLKCVREEVQRRMERGEAELVLKQKMRIEELQRTLDTLDRSVAEEEAIIRSKKEKYHVKTASLAAEEHKMQLEVKAMHAEREATEKKFEEISEAAKNAKFNARVSSSLISALGIQYCKTTGKCLCPEGKVCGFENQSEDECNYWDCPAVQEQIKLVELPKPN